MAKKKTTKKSTATKIKKPSFKLSNQQKLIFGSILLIIGISRFFYVKRHIRKYYHVDE